MTNNLLDEYSIKHLIRSIGDSNLALNLEIARQDGMSFDSFVSLAARAESTQKATRHINFQSKPPVQQFSQRNNNFTPRNEITCFNCGKPGHLSRDCFANRNNQYMSKDNVAAATGANTTSLNTNNNINEPTRNTARIQTLSVKIDEDVGSIGKELNVFEDKAGSDKKEENENLNKIRENKVEEDIKEEEKKVELKKESRVLGKEDKTAKKNNIIVNSTNLRINREEKREFDRKRSIFVGNLPYKTADESVRTHFSKCGKITGVRLLRNKQTGLCKGVGYIEFIDPASIKRAFELNELSFEGRKLRISRIYEKKKLAKMRDKNENLNLKPSNLIKGIEKYLNLEGEFKRKKDRKTLETIPRTELSKYEEGRGCKVKSRSFKADKQIETLKATQMPKIQELGVRNVKSKIVVPRNEKSGRNSTRKDSTGNGLGDQTLRSRWNGKENRRERGLGDQTPRSRLTGNENRRARGLGDRTPRRSVFERIRRYEGSRSRDRL
uniref:Uncharacterized protein n=1 Tax=Meloidogyne enterolobii TaxID=390850 RepID=A0A6V7WIM4_MELEN|nr:unnamed protein product [Meloidogyne enterolobii]